MLLMSDKRSSRFKNLPGMPGKVLAVTLLGLLGIVLIYLLVGKAFHQIGQNVEALARPNARLIEVNRLFRGVAQLGHLQQRDLLATPSGEGAAALAEARQVRANIDTLRVLFSGDSLQLQRLERVEDLLQQRSAVYAEYVRLQRRRNAHPDLREFLRQMTGRGPEGDSLEAPARVVQKEHRVTTTVSSDTLREERSGFFRRLFGSSSPPVAAEVVRTATRVDEEVEIVVDTLGSFRADSLFYALESSLDSLQSFQLKQAARLQQQEFQLLTVNNALVHQMLQVVNALEQEEMALIQAETQAAFGTAGATIRLLNILAVGFIALSLLLTVVVLLDVFKSNRYRRQLERAHAEARKEAAAKQRFLSNMSHEIRTPLQAIYGYAEQARLAGHAQVDVAYVFPPAAHLLQVVDEVLDYARVTSGRMTFERKPFVLKALLAEVVAAFEPAAKKKGLALRMELSVAEQLQVKGDAFRLRQLLYNLLGNALKFTEAGFVALRARWESDGEAGRLVLEVADSGIGMTPEQMGRLFRPFEQADAATSSRFGGTGLGLSIVKEMLDLQGGSIAVESTVGKGSLFKVDLPLLAVEHQPEEVEPPEAPPADFYKPALVWLADDDALIRNLGAAVLLKHHIPHEVFPNGMALLKAFDKERPEVVFLDMRMPGFSGLEVCERLRHRAGGELRIYALTAQVLPEEEELLLAGGFNGVVRKPFREADLLACLQVAPVVSGNMEVDLSVLEQMSGGDLALLTEILESVLVEMRHDLDALRALLPGTEWEEMALLVHRMAGRVGQVGASDYARALRDMELELRRWKEDIDREELTYLLDQGVLFMAEIGDLLARRREQ